jgi:hypothetical protein
MSDDFPEDVRRFLRANIASVAQLELLLLLRSAADQACSIADLSRILCMTPEMCLLQLADLQGRGLVAADEAAGERTFQFKPQSGELAAAVKALQDIYATRRVSVITAIYSEPTDRVRTFADAFKLRKEK